MANFTAARAIFNRIVSALDSRNLKYQTDYDNFRFHISFSTDDLDVKVAIVVDAERDLIRLVSILPFSFPEDKRVEGAVATAIANHGMVHGSFDFNFSDGQILFKLASSYKGGSVDEECIHYLLGVAVGTIDQYDDRFLALAKGNMSLTAFMEKEDK